MIDIDAFEVNVVKTENVINFSSLSTFVLIPWYGIIIEQIGKWNFHPLPNFNKASQSTQKSQPKTDPRQGRAHKLISLIVF